MPLNGESASAHRVRKELIIRRPGLKEYVPVWRDMQTFTDTRQPGTADEAWLVEHPPVFTLGQSGREEHVLDAGDIPLIKTDRGGQVTYHGPGQLVMYLLLDLRRAGLGIRGLVSLLEESVIALLDSYEIRGNAHRKAPGVYVDGKKIASLGLRIRRGCSFHGLSLNVDMDLEPFERIDPCGYRGLEVTQLATMGGPTDLDQLGRELVDQLCVRLGYTPAWPENRLVSIQHKPVRSESNQ